MGMGRDMMEARIGREPTNPKTDPFPFNSDTEKARYKLAAVGELHQTLFQKPNMYQFASTTLDYAFSLVGGQAGSLLLASPGSKNLEFFVSKGPNPVPRQTTVPWNLGIAGSVFHSGISEFVSDVSRDPRHLPNIDRLTGYTTQNLMATPIKRPNGNSLGVVEILNISERVPSQEETDFLQILTSLLSMALHKDWDTKESQWEAMENFVKDCAHDMKNLLMPILEGKKFLREELVEIFQRVPYQEALHMQATLTTCQESLDMIDRNSKRLQKKAKDLVDCLMGRISANDCKPCAVTNITKEALDTLSFPIHQKDLSIELRGLEELPALQGDERKLFSVFYNLLHNAVTAIQERGTIGIHGYREGNHIRINIVDNGPGIPPSEIDMLFSGKKTSKETLGNGYGMKSVRTALEDHGGFIKVTSERGAGTIVHISLPVCGMTEGLDHNADFCPTGKKED